MSLLAALVLADGRFPAGGHAHSGGVEAAIADGRVRDTSSLREFAAGRLTTVGLIEAAFAAAVVVRRDAVRELDAELDARLIAPPTREASRRLGRSLARVASRCWPDPVWLDASDVHQAIALGAACVASAVDAEGAASLAVHHAITTPALAAVRLLGFDPTEVAAMTTDLAAGGAAIVAEAVRAANGEPRDLPCLNGPILEIAALEHRDRPIRMFAT